MTTTAQGIPLVRGILARFANTSPVIVTSLFLLLGALLIAIDAWLPHAGFVRELTVGGGIITDSDKLRDLRFVPIVILFQLALLAAMAVGRFNLPRSATFAYGLLASLLPLYLAFVLAEKATLFAYAALGVGFGAAFRLSRSHWQELTGHMLLAATGMTLLTHHYLGTGPAWSFAVALPLVAVVAVLSNAIVALWAAVLGSVVVAVALFLSAPIFWLGTPNAAISALDVLHALLAFAVVFDTGKVAWQAHRGGQAAMPGIAVAMAIFVLTASSFGSPFLPSDDYHFGEKLLGARALFYDGGWFVSFFSPHGFSDAASAIAAWLIGDLTGTGIAIGEPLYRWYFAALLVFLLVRRIGPLPAAALIMVLPIDNRSVLMLSLGLVLATEVMALRPAALAGALGTIVAAAGVFFNAGPGIAAALVASVAGLILQWRNGPAALRSFVAAGTATGLILMVAFWSEIAGQFHFLKVSAATNLTIYGNGNFSVIMRQVGHFLFVAGPLLAVITSFGKISREGERAGSRLIALLVLIAPATVLAIVLNPYASARLDEAGYRAVFASFGLLVFLPVWIALLKGSRDAAFPAGVLGALLALAISPWPVNLREAKPLFPPKPLAARIPIAEDLPRLGSGTAEPGHVAMIREVGKVVDALLEPGETFLNFTNRNALYFYLDRRNPVPIASHYNAAPESFQRDFLSALGQTPPPLALVEMHNIEHDGISLPLRSHLLYEYLLDTYEPFVLGNYTYAIRKDLTGRLDRLPERGKLPDQVYRIGAYTDVNWQNGIAIGKNAERWSFALPMPLADTLRQGDLLLFSDGVERRVVEIDGTNVRTDPTIEVTAEMEPAGVSFSLVNRKLLLQDLWGKVLHRSQLAKIPSAWGRSMEFLSGKLGATGTMLKLSARVDVEPEPGSSTDFQSTGPDPYLVFTLPESFTPDHAGLLAMEIECIGTKADPLVQVFWRSSETHFSEEASLWFEASFARNLVPLDSSPYWRNSQDISEIRVDIANPRVCPRVRLQGIELFNRAGPATD